MAHAGTPKAILVYKSVHDRNTAQIAHVKADVLGSDCAAPSECPYEKLAGYELLGIGSGVYYGGGFDTWGPLWLTGGLNKKHPDERDFQRARDFAAHITGAIGRTLSEEANGGRSP